MSGHLSESAQRETGGSVAGIIAVVDDDQSVRRALVRLLWAMGYQVVGYASGEEFLVAARSREFDCLLLDIQLNGMSGLDVYAALQESGRAFPVIFISATTDAAGVVAAKTEGRGLFLSKPVDADQLGDALTCRLDVRKSA